MCVRACVVCGVWCVVREEPREREGERGRERAASLRAKDGFMDLCTCGWRDNYIAHCIYGIYGIYGIYCIVLN